MKNIIKLTAAAIVLSAAFAGTASAAVSQNELAGEVRGALGGDSQINVYENAGVVTLTGYYGNYIDQAQAIRAAESVDGVTRVINLANTSN